MNVLTQIFTRMKSVSECRGCTGCRKHFRWRRVLALGGVLVLAITLAMTLGAGFLFMERARVLDGALAIGDQPILLRVDPGMSLRGVTRELSRRGVLERPLYLIWEARWQGTAARIQAGEYELKPGLTPRRLLDKLVQGQVLQRTLTIIEGWNFTELMAAVETGKYLTHTLEKDITDEAIMERLGLPGRHPEGRFYPDTYHFPRGTTDVSFLKRAWSIMEKKLASEWQHRAEGLPYDAPDEALVMASIIEKETGKPKERPDIAGVFVRRLQKGMRLQSDPTVIYGMGDSFDGNIRKADLIRPTPYNTYTIRGLPPTPIAMPGGAAIHAALHPAKGKALYFVAKGDGSHQFSATLMEHNRAVARYQLRRNRKQEKKQ